MEWYCKVFSLFRLRNNGNTAIMQYSNGQKQPKILSKGIACIMDKPTRLWEDRKRHMGLPISFTKYELSENRLFCETGFLNQKEEEILLYRVRDISMSKSLCQRIFGVGTVTIVSSDKTAPNIDLKNIKKPGEVKELIFQKVEEAKDKRRMRTTELLDSSEHDCDVDDQDA